MSSWEMRMYENPGGEDYGKRNKKVNRLFQEDEAAHVGWMDITLPAISLLCLPSRKGV